MTADQLNPELNLDDSNVCRAIADLELVTFIYNADKANILLVADGAKPAMHTALFSESTGLAEPVVRVDQAQIESLIAIVSNLGLRYETETSVFENDDYHFDRFWIFAAREAAAASRLKQAWADSDEKAEGNLLGFPRTAVDAFVQGNLLEIDNPELLKYLTVEEKGFLNHRLSRDNWKEETSYLKSYAQVIKRISPVLYEQIVTGS